LIASLQAALLRAMADEYDSKDPGVARDMRLNAQWFEEKAIEVQLEANEERGSEADKFMEIGVFE